MIEARLADSPIINQDTSIYLVYSKIGR